MKKPRFLYVKDLTMSKGKCTSSISFCNELAISTFPILHDLPYTLHIAKLKKDPHFNSQLCYCLKKMNNAQWKARRKFKCNNLLLEFAMVGSCR